LKNIKDFSEDFEENKGRKFPLSLSGGIICNCGNLLQIGFDERNIAYVICNNCEHLVHLIPSDISNIQQEKLFSVENYIIHAIRPQLNKLIEENPLNVVIDLAKDFVNNFMVIKK
jgi:hypothetical protein